MNVQHKIIQLEKLSIEDGVCQIDDKGKDPLVDFLSSSLIPSDLVQHFSCDCVERALIREREAGREPPHQCWEVLLVKRLWLAGDASDSMLIEARIASEVAVWKHSRKRYKETQAIQQQVAEKLLEATQYLPETERKWQLKAIRNATEAIAWLESEEDSHSDPLFWLGMSEQSIFSGWIEGWNQERRWQQTRLSLLLHKYSEKSSLLPIQAAV